MSLQPRVERVEGRKAPSVSEMRQALGRSWHQKCPHCGGGDVFEKWAEVKESCEVCGYVYEKNPGDTYGFVYMQAALITFVFLMGMYWYFWATPEYVRFLYFLGGAGLMFYLIPHRKSIALALDYLLRSTDVNDVMPDLPPETKL